MSVTGLEFTTRESNMSDTDQQVHALFADAAGDVPPGIDLLRAFRSRKTARRVRGRVALGAAAASLVAAVTAVTLTITTAPSALAQVTGAASRTAGLSYDITATVAIQPSRAGSGSGVAMSGQISGAFDPARKTGETTLSGTGGEGQMRLIGPYAYIYMPPRPGRPALPAGKTWLRVPSSQLWEPVVAAQGLNLGGGLSSLLVTSPQNLLALLNSASAVNRQGTTSGDGWTGTSYTFTARLTLGPNGSSEPAVTAAGTVGVDQQGRVRRLTLAYTQPAQASLPPTRVTVEVTFSDFGTAVSVSPPPASEVYIPANINFSPASAS
jgi:hypothetical protein